MRRLHGIIGSALLVLLLSATTTTQASTLSPELLDWLQSGYLLDDEISIIVQVSGPLSTLERQEMLAKARRVQELEQLGMISMSIPAREIPRWAASPRVVAISIDTPVQAMAAPGYSQIAVETGYDRVDALYGYDGTGVTVAVLDSGLGKGLADFPATVTSTSFVPLKDSTDNYGHGTHVASTLLGRGTASKTLGFNFEGIADHATPVAVKVLDDNGQGQTSWVLAGINWVLTNKATYGIRIVNLSLGAPATQSYKTDPLCQATKRLYDAGIVTVVSAGNYGKGIDGRPAYGSITSPGNSPWVITVGAANDNQTASRADDAVASYSSRGPTRSYDATAGRFDNLVKPDILATGTRIAGMSPATNAILSGNPDFNLAISGTSNKYFSLSGTSVAAPVVSGVVALMLEANPQLTPSMVKAILMYSAQTLPGASVFDQGAGLVNAEGAVRFARALSGKINGTPAYGTVLLAPSQMPNPTSTVSGVTFPWSKGNVLVRRTGRTGLVQSGGIIFAEGILFAEGVVSAKGIVFAEGILFAEGVIFAERNVLVTRGAVVSGTLPKMTLSGAMDASGILFAEAATLGSGNLYNASGIVFAEGVIFAEGMVYTDTSSSSYPTSVKSGRDSSFTQGILFAEGVLLDASGVVGLETKANNVLVAGESFMYK